MEIALRVQFFQPRSGDDRIMAGSGTGTAVSGAAAGGGIVTAPTLEPITIAELKLHLRIDSGSFADNIDETQSLPPDEYAVTTAYDHLGAGVDVLGYDTTVILSAGTNAAGATLDVKIQEADGNTELLTLDVAPATDWEADDVITGQTSGTTCISVAKISALTYTVKNRSGLFTLGEIIGVTGVGAKLADQGAANPVFTLSLYTDWTGGTYTQVTTTNDNAIQEIAYTGTKQYIRTVAKVLVDVCTFGTQIIRLTATTAENDLLNDDIKTAREHVEDITGRALYTQTWDYFLDEWPAGNRIKIPNGNLQTAGMIVTYYSVASDGTKTTNTMTLTTDYLIEQNGDQCGFIVLPYGKTWPSFTAWPTQSIRIRYQCGWTTRALIPYKIKQAIKRICSMLYESRGEDVLGQTVTEDKTVERLLRSVRLWDNF